MFQKKLVVFVLSFAMASTFFIGCGSTSEIAADGEDVTATAEVLTETSAKAPADPYEGLTFYESQSGLSIYMADGFEEDTAEGAVCYYESEDCGLLCQKDDFQILEDYEYDTNAMTAADYAALIMEIYETGSDVTTDEYGNTCVYYEQDVMGMSVSYYGFYHKGTDAFWGTTFFCPAENGKDFEEDFRLWASSVAIP